MKKQALFTALAALLTVSGCASDGPAVCDSEHVIPELVRIFTEDQSDSIKGVFANARLGPTSKLGTDEVTGVAQCSARLILPTEHGPLDVGIEYRVGPKASDGSYVLMQMNWTDEHDQFFRVVERVARQAEEAANRG